MARQATPIQYLTRWRLVGNSSVQSNEIWSCGELSATDNKYHIYVSSNGKVFDIALTEPLRKVNSVADKIEFPSEQEGKAIVTRNLGSVDMGGDMTWVFSLGTKRMYSTTNIGCKYVSGVANILCAIYDTITNSQTQQEIVGIATQTGGNSAICVYDGDYVTSASKDAFVTHLQGVDLVYELETPTTETIEVPEIEVSSTDTYTQIISQGAKAVAWTSFTPNPEEE